MVREKACWNSEHISYAKVSVMERYPLYSKYSVQVHSMHLTSVLISRTWTNVVPIQSLSVAVSQPRECQVSGGVSRRPQVPSDWLRQGGDLSMGHQSRSAHQEFPC